MFVTFSSRIFFRIFFQSAAHTHKVCVVAKRAGRPARKQPSKLASKQHLLPLSTLTQPSVAFHSL